MLKELHLQQVGPSDHFNVEFASRLNIFTGDNGLGKSFLLDIAWWVLTSNWVEQAAYAQQGRDKHPQITGLVSNVQGEINSKHQSLFDFSSQQWRNLDSSSVEEISKTGEKQNHQAVREVVIYVRVDGGFSVYDPVRKRDNAYNFTSYTLWNGLKSNDKVLCNGLIQDWVTWQNQPNKYPFQLFSHVIQKLAPHPDEWISVGETTRVSVEDVRDIPTINLPYGNVPVTQISAGMKRILGLAYLLVWTWYEHTLASQLLSLEPVEQIVLLIDEIESHLHPRWQRVILPAILTVVTELQVSIKVQALVTTHSPLILASLEPNFDEEEDRLFLFKLSERKVTLDEVLWSKQGDTVGWLTSEIFGLKQARSQEAEIAIEAAEAWMRNDDMGVFGENLRTQAQIHQELQRVLPGHDPFWSRWIVTSEKRSSNLSGA